MNKITSSKFFIFLLILILIGIIAAVGKESYRKYQIDKQVADLEQQIESLKEKNQTLSNLINYFVSEESLEKEARLKLNLVKEGEKLVIISSDKKNEPENRKSNNQKENLSNLERWWKYFFSQ